MNSHNILIYFQFRSLPKKHHSRSLAPKVMPPVLLCWLTTSEADAGGMAVEVEPSANIPLHYVAVWQMTAEGQSDRVVSVMEVHMEQRGVTEFLHAEKTAPTDIHWWLLNVDGDQTVDVSTVRWWVVLFSSGDSDTKDKPCWGWPFTSVTLQNEERLNSLAQIG